MARVSQAQAQQNRERVVETAARLFRERGVAGVSVADLMAAAGLTHGGFYKQFASKEALVAEAAGRAFADQETRVRTVGERHPGDPDAARKEWISQYLSLAHRDNPGEGCPTTALAPDVAREALDSPARAPFLAGVESYARHLSDGDEIDDEALVTLSTMVGALLISRATAGSPLSDRVLAATRDALT
ncbi:TetR/AcrR family transcriptional regulator [Catenuloplanes sp. NPDC051500]|uniref:TetR/AcrR family transcriptional regulator n=1 Tax=Catenuloplanes sp. NPDC051500 TaxID=3363959 RepID=UPI0037A15E6E